MLGELVLAPGQGRVARRLVVKALFDLALQVLGPEAHAEGLALQHKAAVHQHPEGIPRRVPHRKDQRLAGERPGRGQDAGQAAVFPFQTREGGVEVHLAPQRFDLFADGGDDPPQQVGAHMGLLLPGNLRRGSVLQKHLGDKAAQLIPDAGGELAVREGARAALAELDVRIFIQLAGGGKMRHGLHPLVQRRAALQHDGPIPLPGQQQRGKQARRPQPADDGAVGQRLGAALDGKIGLLRHGAPGVLCKRGLIGLVFQGDGHGIHQFGLAVAGVHREPGNAQMADLPLGDAGGAERFFKGLGLPRREGQADIADKYHCKFLTASPSSSWLSY